MDRFVFSSAFYSGTLSILYLGFFLFHLQEMMFRLAGACTYMVPCLNIRIRAADGHTRKEREERMRRMDMEKRKNRKGSIERFLVS